jgi:hypothetical protein
MLERDELRRLAQQQQEKMDELLHEREHVQGLANAVNELRYSTSPYQTYTHDCVSVYLM